MRYLYDIIEGLNLVVRTYSCGKNHYIIHKQVKETPIVPGIKVLEATLYLLKGKEKEEVFTTKVNGKYTTDKEKEKLDSTLLVNFSSQLIQYTSGDSFKELVKWK